MNLLKHTLYCSLTISVLAFSVNASANHSWNDYHWASKTSTINLKVVDSTTADWDQELNDTLNAWSQSSSPFLFTIAASDDASRTRKRCSMVSGQLKVCNASYGQNGWLGLASINIDSSGHITQGTAKMNDSYGSYWTDQAEKNHVMCQEVGHVFGLGHTSEDGSSQKTCMDYSNDVNSQWPNAHDYQMLASMYNHLESYNSYDDGTGSGSGGCKGGPKRCGNGKGNSEYGLGHKILSADKYEIWVKPERDGTLTVHHVYLAK
jgi:hypothetical protein